MGSSSFVLALKYALDISTMRICVRCSLSGSWHTFQSLPKSVVAIVKIILNDSNGGVGAKMASCPAVRISLATRRLLMLGDWSSPLLVSTQRTEMGIRPMTFLASLMDLRSQTPLARK